jgi:hypothetical protein
VRHSSAGNPHLMRWLSGTREVVLFGTCHVHGLSFLWMKLWHDEWEQTESRRGVDLKHTSKNWRIWPQMSLIDAHLGS